MDSNNYVGQKGNQYVVVVNGKQVGSYSDESQAEQAYNGATGQSNTPSGPTTYTVPQGTKTLAEMQQELQKAGWGGDYNDANAVVAAYSNLGRGLNADGSPVAGGVAGGTTADSSYQKMMDAIASGNQQQFDEAVREFNATNQLNQQQLYANTAQNLLSDASKLTGPADYYQFQQYASGGRSLMDQLFGNQPRAAFTAAQGPNIPLNIQTLMQELGFRTAPDGSSTSTNSSGGTQQYQTADGILTIQQMIDRLKQAGWPNADKNPSDQDVITAYQNTTHTPVTPYTAPSTSTSSAQTATNNPNPVGFSSPQTNTTNALASHLGIAGTAPQSPNLTGTSPSNTVSPTNYISGGGLKAYGNMSTSSGPSGISSGAGTTSAPAQSSGSGVPVYDKGGAIQGNPGQHILALLQSGEKVTPAPSNTPQGQTRFAGDLPAWQMILGHILGAAANQGRVPVYDNGGIVSGTSMGTNIPSNITGYKPINIDNYNGRAAADAFRQKMVNTSPFQVNPLQWDSLGKVGQQLVLGAVQANGWDPTEWQAQLDAQRPNGTAPKQTLMQYYTPASSGNAAPAGVY